MLDETRRQCHRLVYASRVFEGRIEQVRQVRQFVNSISGHSPDSDPIRQVVSELSANAVAHSRSGQSDGQFRVQVCAWAGGAYVMVTDQGGCDPPPTAPEVGLWGEHGRGLVLVSALSTWWGWFGDATGRTFLALFLHRGGRGRPC